MAAVTGLKFANRVKNILLHPAAEWDRIGAESAAPADVLAYIALLAALPPLSWFVTVFLKHGFLSHAPIYAVVSYITSFVCAGAATVAIGFFAPRFGGRANGTRAAQLFAYSMTAAWIAGIARLIPYAGGVLGLLGIYCVYIFYLGAPKLVKIYPARARVFTGLVFAAATFCFVVILLVTGLLGASYDTEQFSQLFPIEHGE